MIVEWSDEAILELTASMHWWEEKHGVPSRLEAEVSTEIERLKKNPLLGIALAGRRFKSLRVLTLHDVPFRIFYCAENEENLQIISIWHTSRGLPRQ
jgi:plasmid stabilization system protein ParE